jgi:hypothetical protein
MIESDGTQKVMRYWNSSEAAVVIHPEIAKLVYGDAMKLIPDRLEGACRWHLITDVRWVAF